MFPALSIIGYNLEKNAHLQKDFSYFHYEDFFNLKQSKKKFLNTFTDLNQNAPPFSPKNTIIASFSGDNVINDLLNQEKPFFEFNENENENDLLEILKLED